PQGGTEQAAPSQRRPHQGDPRPVDRQVHGGAGLRAARSEASTGRGRVMSETQIHRIFINASPERVWEAITTPEFTRLYGYTGDADYAPSPGGHYEHRASDEMKSMGMPDVVVTGEVLESDPPRRLVQTWGPVWIQDEEPGTVTWDIEPTADGATRLTLTHDLT